MQLIIDTFQYTYSAGASDSKESLHEKSFFQAVTQSNAPEMLPINF